ncbi:MAG: hypothetical protein KA354_20400 [Phycisphaerae bacterium]|nr:hypothetical protein [Phycisphaerae bacterium]
MRNNQDERGTHGVRKPAFLRLVSAGLAHRSFVRLTLVVGAFCSWAACSAAADGPAIRERDYREQAVSTLRAALRDAPRWVKVHAAESLLALDYPQDILPIFQQELRTAGNQPEYRIGIWRVLARASTNDRQQQQWVNRIVDVFMDQAAPDRNHAAETLAKLKYVPSAEVSDELARVAAHTTGPFSVNARWALANAGQPEAERPLLESLSSDRTDVRINAAYALRHLTKLSPASRQTLTAAAENEPADSPARVYLLGTAAVQAGLGENGRWAAPLVHYAIAGKPDEAYEACAALASMGTKAEVRVLAELLSAAELDTRVAAANAILRIGRRAPHRMSSLDWAVIGAYCLGMLAIGWYYARRSKTTEDYLLGGRRMNPLIVGISLFATLMSTISYLSWPGEVIRYGPIMVCGAVAAYPFVALVVGWFMIPFIMKLRVTSAYQILEANLGHGVRLLGSTMFLTIRLLWMAVIIYATVNKVLIPLTGLPEAIAPYVCLLMGLIVLVYTSMGGLRAVVLTDVVQGAILFGGAILVFAVITVRMGGIGAWWPTAWPAHWPEVVWGYDGHARTTFAGIMIAMFTWYICTSGSDQIAVQRYLATRDARAARRVLITSLLADGLTTLFLGLLGLPLMAFFQAHPEMIPDGQTLTSNADTLFPQFIVFGLPAGITGLVIAGLLAAAMSSLSSGVNASCSVVMSDFLGRAEGAEGEQGSPIRLARLVSAIIGGVVIVLSSYVGIVRGNLLEVAFKLVNLCVAPLFGLFFTAMFISWATPLGALSGLVFGLATVIGISYWQELTGTPGISFVWALPLALLVQILISAAFSILPFGRRGTR